MRSTWTLLLPVLLAVLGCSRGRPTSSPGTEILVPVLVEVPGLHNVYRLNERLVSGSSPEGDEGFASLCRLGVKTVLSVDGARPDLARARKHGLRYVHLPIGYDGVPREQALRIARAVRDLPGPVYVHCHHGKHRGPAAAAVALLFLDESCGPEQAVAWLRRAGTDPRYQGLYAAPRQLRRPTKEELDAVPARFPEAADVGGMARLMVRLDQHWDHLALARRAGWKTPPGHPDVDPPHEALQMAELYREAARLPQLRGKHRDELRRWLAEAEATAQRLEAVLDAGKKAGVVDRAETEKAFGKAAADCTRCHARYRDVPQQP
jgi:protein tyrosine phosphatase (PTP) superfamily phosphohydrolase (DUF442 family)